MNFTDKVKGELLSKPSPEEVYGFIYTRRGSPVIFFNRALGRYFYTLLKSITSTTIKSSGRAYKVYFEKIEEKETFQNSEALSFLKGAFLSTGYISHPKKKSALDIFFPEIKSAQIAQNLFSSLGFSSSIYSYRDGFRVSLRDSETIKDFIFSLGASESFFEYEDMSILKSFKEKNVRSINLALANDERQAIATSKQLDIIEKLRERGLIVKLDDGLRSYIEAREKNQELSIGELSELLGISKSSTKRKMKILESLI